MEYETKNDVIYRNLKDAIIEGRLRPNERIVISDIAQKYNLSPMPVREALKRLQQDGLVDIVPHVGARVISININEFKEITEVRTALEVYAAKIATPYINDEKVRFLQNLIDEMEASAIEKDNQKYALLNKQFHTEIYKASPNKFLYELILSLWEKTEMSKRVFFNNIDRAVISVREHKEWLNAIKEHDSNKSAELAKRHKEEAFKILYQTLGNDNFEDT